MQLQPAGPLMPAQLMRALTWASGLMSTQADAETCWHGTANELARLRDAIANQCTCEVQAMRNPSESLCSAHMLLRDQRVLDHLLFAFRLREQFVRHEWKV